eukprot:6194196-Pleurochrysis_carterae.AAC.2
MGGFASAYETTDKFKDWDLAYLAILVRMWNKIKAVVSFCQDKCTAECAHTKAFSTCRRSLAPVHVCRAGHASVALKDTCDTMRQGSKVPDTYNYYDGIHAVGHTRKGRSTSMKLPTWPSAIEKKKTRTVSNVQTQLTCCKALKMVNRPRRS